MAPPEGAGPVTGTRRSLARADGVAGDDELDASILLASGGGAVGRHRRALAEPAGSNRARRNALLHEIGPHRCAASLRQLLVVVFSAHVVGVPFDLDPQSLM